MAFTVQWKMTLPDLQCEVLGAQYLEEAARVAEFTGSHDAKPFLGLYQQASQGFHHQRCGDGVDVLSVHDSSALLGP